MSARAARPRSRACGGPGSRRRSAAGARPLGHAALRPADRAPFAPGGLAEPYPPEDGAPPPEPRPFPLEVPLRLAGTGPQAPLDTAGLAQLAATVWAMNGGPTGVQIEPPPGRR